MEKHFYSISEVAEMLKESPSLVRFWSNSFPNFIKPVRNAKGNRQYTAQDIETLKQLHYLIKEKGMTLDGAGVTLREERRNVESRVKALDSLKEIRTQLEEIRKSL